MQNISAFLHGFWAVAVGMVVEIETKGEIVTKVKEVVRMKVSAILQRSSIF